MQLFLELYPWSDKRNVGVGLLTFYSYFLFHNNHTGYDTKEKNHISTVMISATSIHSHLQHSHLLYISHIYNLMSHHYGINPKNFYILSETNIPDRVISETFRKNKLGPLVRYELIFFSLFYMHEYPKEHHFKHLLHSYEVPPNFWLLHNLPNISFSPILGCSLTLPLP